MGVPLALHMIELGSGYPLQVLTVLRAFRYYPSRINAYNLETH